MDVIPHSDALFDCGYQEYLREELPSVLDCRAYREGNETCDKCGACTIEQLNRAKEISKAQSVLFVRYKNSKGEISTRGEFFSIAFK